MGTIRRRRAGGALAAGLALTVLAGCDLGTPPATYAAQGALWAAGDATGDGVVDLVTSGDASGFGLLIGDGTGAFTPTVVAHDPVCDASDPTRTCTQVLLRAAVDMSGDGLLDVIVQYTFVDQNRTLHVEQFARLADGVGGFGPPVSLPSPAQSPADGGVFGDVTGDGYVDRVSTSNWSTPPFTLIVLPGDGLAGFGPPVTTDLSALGLRTPALDLHDMNRDGKLDLVLGGSCLTDASGEAWLRGCADILLGDGVGGFTIAGRAMAADPEVDSLVAKGADLNEDGAPDLVATGSGATMDGGGPVGALSVFPGNGAGGLGAESAQAANTETFGFQVADFDADGHLDLLTRTDNHNGNITDDYARIRFGDGGGAFPDVHVLGTGGGGLVADFDGDGRPDYAVKTSEGVAVYMNSWQGRPE